MTRVNAADAGNVPYEPLGDDSFQILNSKIENDCDLFIYGYQNNFYRKFIYYFFTILLVGSPHIICQCHPKLKMLKHKSCSLKNADFILLRDSYGNKCTLRIHTVSVYLSDQEQMIKFFTYQHIKYVWQNEFIQFAPLNLPYENNLSLGFLLDNSLGLTREQEENAINLFGKNAITIEVKSYCQLLVQEVFNPFYLFQIFSIGLWSCDEYYIYAGCIFFLSVLSIATSLYETKKQSLALHNLVESSKCKLVNVQRPQLIPDEEGNKYCIETIDATHLVPDDIIILPKDGCVMPCDAILLTGLCIVNESMLTGESVPVTKTPPSHSDEIYDVDIHKRHTIFSGTKVIQTRFYGGSNVIARVIRTGFQTSKGELIKSILYPKPTGLQFYKDSMKFVLFLSVIASVGMVYCIYLYAERKANLKEIFIRALDIITIVVPPALPAAMTVGTIYSQNRLKKLKIFCISPPRINVCGKLKLVCFDKTGTLTQDGLEFYGVLPTSNGEFEDFVQEPWQMDHTNELIHSMATCHSLTRIDSELSGDPLDLGMFEATKWELDEPGEENTRFDMLVPTSVKPKITPPREDVPFDMVDFDVPYEIGILQQFPFSSAQQCMSVICRTIGARHMTVYTKGAPEKLQMMCRTESLPRDFVEVLSNYAMSGYRVIAIAYKNLPRKLMWKDALKMKRDTVECDLDFLGLIVMQNSLKPETTPIINELHDAKIRTVMVTGDNIMTAISVSRNCGMVLPNEDIIVLKECCTESSGQPRIAAEIFGSPNPPDGPLIEYQNGDCLLNFVSNLGNARAHIAMDGRTWAVLKNFYSESVLVQVAAHGTVFARFRPDQKTQLVEQLQALDYVVGMCGDGANDCGALKAANIGISLSQAEASVAAPFTSALQNISCVKHLVSEGRCALVTSFSVFKYMAMYSLIQFFTVLILYKRYTTLGNMQFLYIDLVITTSLAVTMGYQKPSNILVTKRPMGSLVSLVNLIPLFMQIFLCGLMQYAALYYLTLQPWFTALLKSSYVEEEVIICWENTVVFSISCFQYIILACVYSKGWPYRESIFSNYLLLITAFLLVAFTTVLLVYPIQPLSEYFDMIPVSKDYQKLIFRSELMIIPVLHFILAIIIEHVIAPRRCLKTVAHFLKRKKCPKNKYKQIEANFDIHNWLDICQHTQQSSII